MNTGPIFNRLHCISLQLTIICNELTTLKLCNAFSADGYDVNFIYKVKIVYCLWYQLGCKTTWMWSEIKELEKETNRFFWLFNSWRTQNPFFEELSPKANHRRLCVREIWWRLGYQACFSVLLRKRSGGGREQTTKKETACNDFGLFPTFDFFSSPGLTLERIKSQQ